VTRRDVRNIVWAVHLGFLQAATVFVISVAGDFARVWPGTAVALVSGTAGWWLILDRRSRP
jgi:hypothetical protein